jgi:hypothetical protein
MGYIWGIYGDIKNMGKKKISAESSTNNKPNEPTLHEPLLVNANTIHVT